MTRIALGLALLLIGASTAQAAATRPSIYAPPHTLYHYGPGNAVQHHPVTHLVFWGPRWRNDPTGIVAAEEQTFNQLPTSGYARLLRQYGVREGRNAPPTFDRHPTGAVDYAALQRVAARAAHGHPSRNDQWVILAQPGADMSRFTGGCAEHDMLGAYNVLIIPPFSNPGYGDECQYDYSADDGNRTPTLVASMTSIASHEWAEAATNPGYVGGWETPDTTEVADLCAWYSGTPAGMTQNVTYLWSDAAGGCVL